MTTEAEQKRRRTVTATVLTHGVHNGRPKTDLDIPEFGSKYPIPIYGMPPEMVPKLPVGQTRRVILQADRLKDGADPAKIWNYFFSVVDLDPDQTIPMPDPLPDMAPAPEQQHEVDNPNPPQRPAAKSGYEATQAAKDRSIQRQVALKAAVDFCVGHGSNSDSVMPIAQAFFDWLAEAGE